MGKINILSKDQLGDFNIALDPVTKVPEIISSKLGQLKLAFGFTKFEVESDYYEESLMGLPAERLSITHEDILNSIEDTQCKFQSTNGGGGLLFWRKI